MKVLSTLILATGLACLSGLQAQTLSSFKVDPSSIKAGESIKATLGFDKADQPNCGMKIHWGDGQFTEAKINQAKDVPFVASHTYAKAGSYKLMAEPKRVGPVLKCDGKNIEATVVVAAVPVAAGPAQAAPAVVAAPPVAPALTSAPTAPKAAAKPSLCPEGWSIVKPGQNAKTKAFSCSAKSGTAIPEPKISCPGDLTYFENSKKGQLGCRV